MADLSDAEAKDVMRDFPKVTGILLVATGDEKWVRCCPNISNDTVAMPFLTNAGGSKQTMPDGMYSILYPDKNCADIIVFEACRSSQNLYDKQARYGPNVGARMLNVNKTWLETIVYRKPMVSKPRWEHMGTFKSGPLSDLALPIRNSKVVFVIPDARYEELQEENNSQPHEFYFPMSMFRGHVFWTESFRKFSAKLVPTAHFYTD